MNGITFESLLDRAKKTDFYKVWIDEATEEECQYYRDYFNKYPNKGSYDEFYESALKKHACILFTSWEYETYTTVHTPEEFLALIEKQEEEEKQYQL